MGSKMGSLLCRDSVPDTVTMGILKDITTFTRHTHDRLYYRWSVDTNNSKTLNRSPDSLIQKVKFIKFTSIELHRPRKVQPVPPRRGRGSPEVTVTRNQQTSSQDW